MLQVTNADDLYKLFNDCEDCGFNSFTSFIDKSIGFSVQKSYPSNISFKPVKNKNGEDDDVAVIWVVYDEKYKDTDHLIPIRLRIDKLSRYRAKNYAYDFDDVECPSKESVQESTKTRQPFELNFVRDYFLDLRKSCIVDTNGKSISGAEILEKIFKSHCDTTHPIKGIGIRSKYGVINTIFSVLEGLIRLVKFSLKVFFGRQLNEQLDRSVYFHGYLDSDFKRIEIDSLELGGYRASKQVIMLFCSLVVIASSLLLPVTENTYIGNLVGNDFLMIIHSIFVLYILDEIVPYFLFKFVNFVIFIRKNLFNKFIRSSFL